MNDDQIRTAFCMADDEGDLATMALCDIALGLISRERPGYPIPEPGTPYAEMLARHDAASARDELTAIWDGDDSKIIALLGAALYREDGVLVAICRIAIRGNTIGAPDWALDALAESGEHYTQAEARVECAEVIAARRVQ